MGLFSSMTRSLALGVAETKIREHGKPYGVKLVRGLETRSGGQFSVTIELEGDVPVRVTGTLRIKADSVTLTSFNTGRRWLDLIAHKFLVGRVLPFPPEDVEKLKLLWPN